MLRSRLSRRLLLGRRRLWHRRHVRRGLSRCRRSRWSRFALSRFHIGLSLGSALRPGSGVHIGSIGGVRLAIEPPPRVRALRVSAALTRLSHIITLAHWVLAVGHHGSSSVLHGRNPPTVPNATGAPTGFTSGRRATSAVRRCGAGPEGPTPSEATTGFEPVYKALQASA